MNITYTLLLNNKKYEVTSTIDSIGSSAAKEIVKQFVKKISKQEYILFANDFVNTKQNELIDNSTIDELSRTESNLVDTESLKYEIVNQLFILLRTS